MPPLEHKWLSPIYTWAADYSSLTATRNCYLHEGEAETETVHATTTVVYPPSEEYETAYAAFSDEFINSAFAAQYTIIRTIPPLSTLNVLDLPEDLETIESEAFAGANCEAVLVPDGCTMQIPENRCIYSAPAVRSVRLKRCKYEIPHGARYREKRGVPTATGGKEGKSFPPRAV